MPTRTLNALLDRMDANGIARRSDLRGCSDGEIDALERRYRIRLPESYRCYLVAMGHESGKLLTHDHYAATYEHVLTLTESYREDWDDSVPARLPTDALVIVGRLSEQFLVIRCNDTSDSPVSYINEYDPDLSPTFPTVLDWLYSLADEAESAIESGYYTLYPNGTSP